MSVTIRKIAKEVGVSVAAVSKALNNRPGVSLPLKLKIEKVAERLGYSPYVKARKTGMYARGLKYIGVIYARAGEHLIREIQEGIDSVLKKSGFYEIRYGVNIYGELDDEQRKEIFLEKILEDKSIVGLLSVFLDISDVTIAKLQKEKIPVVLLNNCSDYGQCVFIDNADATYKAVKKLIELGHKNIGLIMPEERTERVWHDRLEGYKKALKEHNIPYNPSLMVYEHSFDLKEAGLATEALLEREPTTTAILYGSDIQAYGGMKMLQEMGVKIPEDIAIVGFDDMAYSRISNPPLASIRQPMKEMGEKGAKLLLESIGKEKFPHKSLKLNAELIIRKSLQKDIPEEKWL